MSSIMQSKASFMYSKGLAVHSCLQPHRFLSLSLKISFDTVLNPVTRQSCAALPMNNHMTAESFCASNSHISKEGNQTENGTFFGGLTRNAEIMMHKAHEVPPAINAAVLNLAFGGTFGNVIILKGKFEVKRRKGNTMCIVFYNDYILTYIKYII
jgi:hypothetical protein